MGVSEHLKAGFKPSMGLTICAQVLEDTLNDLDVGDQQLLSQVLVFMLQRKQRFQGVQLTAFYEKLKLDGYITYEMMASPSVGLNTHRKADFQVYINCLLPLEPLVHLPLETFEGYMQAKYPALEYKYIDVSDIEAFVKVFDACHCVIIAWLNCFPSLAYYDKTFQFVFMKESHVWVNFLAALGI